MPRFQAEEGLLPRITSRRDMMLVVLNPPQEQLVPRAALLSLGSPASRIKYGVPIITENYQNSVRCPLN
jgi:hypothetical protein